MILPPPGFAQPNPDPSLRPLLEQEMRDLIALPRSTEWVDTYMGYPRRGGVPVIVEPVIGLNDYIRGTPDPDRTTYETRDPALQLAGKETKP